MSTQKVRPDRGFTERQEFRQRRKTRNQKIGTYVVVGAVAAVAVIALATARGGGSGTTVPGASAPPSAAAPVAVTHSYVDIATGERSPVAADLLNARVPEVSPDLSNVVYEDSGTITVAALDGSARETITPTDLDGYLPTWIDDETILFQGRPAGTGKFGGLYFADVSSGELTKVADLPELGSGLPWLTRSDLSPDGTTLLYHLPRHEGERFVWDLWTAPLAGGRATLLREDAGWGTYAPDGSIVFFDHPVNFGSNRMSVIDGRGNNARTLLKFPDDEEGLGWLQVSPDGTMVYGLREYAAHLVDIDTGEELGEVDGFFGEEEPTWYGNDTLIVD